MKLRLLSVYLVNVFFGKGKVCLSARSVVFKKIRGGPMVIITLVESLREPYVSLLMIIYVFHTVSLESA